MSVLPDPLTDVIGLFLKRAMDAKIFRYAVLVLEMAIAGAIAGFAASGIALISGQDVAWSVGAGMTATAVAWLATFAHSPNAKGLIISLPQAAEQQEQQQNVVTVERK